MSLLAACSGGGRPETARHVVLLGLDGGTWDLLDPYIRRGLLPNLARLRESGAWAPLKSTEPSSSPVIWTSIATGKTPEKHGIEWFVRFPDGDAASPEPVTSTMRRGKALWNILTEKGHDVAVVGWFVTWPVESVNGRMISDRAHWGATDERGVFPPAYLAGLQAPTMNDALSAAPEFTGFVFDPANVARDSPDPQARLNFLVLDRLLKAWARDTFYLRAAEKVLADGALPEFLAVYFRGTDDVQHGFWKFMQPDLFEGVTPEQVEQFGKVIERYWQWTDAAVGRILSYYDGLAPLVLVVSDHGAGPALGPHAVTTPKHLHLSGAHRDTGILVAAGPGVRAGRGAQNATIYDVTPTILHYLGHPVGGDMDGRPLTELFDLDREPARIATYDEGEHAPAGHLSSEVDDQALEHLRSLGYID